MRIHFLDATRTTTGVHCLFAFRRRRLRLEGGLFQRRRGEFIERHRNQAVEL